MSVRRDVLSAIGGFREFLGNNKDKNLVHAGFKWLQHQAGDEETELCIRVHATMAQQYLALYKLSSSSTLCSSTTDTLEILFMALL